MAERFEGIAVIEAPRGRDRQMNAGAAETSAEGLLFLHADTRLPDGALGHVRAALGGGAVAGCFEAGGAFRQQLRNGVLWTAWRLGVPPQRLARFYLSPSRSA